MLDWHLEGGVNYMIPLTLLLLINLCVIGFVFVAAVRKKQLPAFWMEAIRQVGLLALAWGVLSTIIGLYQAFGDLSRMTETLPLYVIMGGMKVALITAEYGLIIYVVSLAAHLGLRVMTRNRVA